MKKIKILATWENRKTLEEADKLLKEKKMKMITFVEYAQLVMDDELKKYKSAIPCWIDLGALGRGRLDLVYGHWRDVDLFRPGLRSGVIGVKK